MLISVTSRCLATPGRIYVLKMELPVSVKRFIKCITTRPAYTGRKCQDNHFLTAVRNYFFSEGKEFALILGLCSKVAFPKKLIFNILIPKLDSTIFGFCVKTSTFLGVLEALFTVMGDRSKITHWSQNQYLIYPSPRVSAKNRVNFKM